MKSGVRFPRQETVPEIIPQQPFDGRAFRLLLVDDDLVLLRGLVRAIYSIDPDIEVFTCGSAMEGLEFLGQHNVDALVTDLHMPRMNGADFLAEVRGKYPHILRFVLSGEAKPEIFLNASNHAHQCMSKPCEAAKLLELVASTFRHFHQVRDPVVSKYLSWTAGLPDCRKVMNHIIELLENESSSLPEVTAAVQEDPSLVARILKVANSPFFGFQGKIEGVEDAVALLGLDTVAGMVASHKIFAQSPPPPEARLNVEALWEHSAFTATMARFVAPRLKLSATSVKEGLTASLLHDIGKLILACSLPTNYGAAWVRSTATSIPLWASEMLIFGADHATVGGTLLRIWGVPPAVVEAVAYHHAPHLTGAKEPSPAVLVHVADALAHAMLQDNRTILLESDYLDSIGLPSRTEDWVGLLKH